MSDTTMLIWSLPVMHSTSLQRPLETLCYPVWFDVLVEREAWMWSQNEDVVVSRHQMWVEVSRQGTVVHRHEGSGGPAHTNETVFPLVLSANEVYGEVALCVPNSWPGTSTERWHWGLIAVVAAALSTLHCLLNFHTYFIPYLPTFRIGPSVSMPEIIKGDQTWLGFYFFILCYSIFCYGCMFIFVALDLVFQY